MIRFTRLCLPAASSKVATFVVATSVLCTASSSIGCRRPPAPKPNTATKTDSKGPAAQRDSKNELIQSVVSILSRNTDIGIYPTVGSQLNLHFAREGLEPTPPSNEAALRELLGPAAVQEATRPLFSTPDVAYLQTCVNFARIAGPLTKENQSDLANASRLAEWSVRFVQAPPALSEGALPEPELPPWLCSLRGTGSARCRAWVMLELFRQAGLMGVIVETVSPAGIEATEALAPPDRPLVGLVGQADVHLFDPDVGTPILNKSGAIATLAELRAQPTLRFRTKDYPGKKVLDDKAAPTFAIRLLAQSPMIAPRMQKLEAHFVGAVRPRITLDLLGQRQRAVTVLANLGQSNAEKSVTVWSAPSEIDQQMRAPAFQARFNQTTNPVWFALPDSPRMQQVLGQTEQAIGAFVGFDSMSREELAKLLVSEQFPPSQAPRLESWTRQDATYFLGVCQLSLVPPSPRVARDWFQRYQSAYGTSKLRPENVVHWGGLYARLFSASKEGQQGPTRRVWDALGQANQQIIAAEAERFAPILQAQSKADELREQLDAMKAQSMDVNGSTDEKQQMERVQAELLVLTQFLAKSMTQQLEGERRVIGALNAILEKKDLFPAETFPPNAPRPIAAMIEQDPAKLDASALLRRNRFLLGVALPEIESGDRRTWLAGSRRGIAESLELEGKRAEAIDYLEQSAGDLSPREQASLLAYAAYLRSQSKADDD